MSSDLSLGTRSAGTEPSHGGPVKLVSIGAVTRVGVAVFVYLLAVWAHTSVTTRTGPPLALAESLYVSLQLFVLQPYGLPRPHSGEPGWALWLALFLAPGVVAAAAVESISLLHSRFVSGARAIARMRKHIIVCGLGDHGKAVVRSARMAGREVVGIEAAAQDEWLSLANERIPVVRGDMAVPDVLKRAGVKHAAEVWFASGDAIRNLNAALVAAKCAELEGQTSLKLIPMIDRGDDEAFVLRCFAYDFPSTISVRPSDAGTKRAGRFIDSVQRPQSGPTIRLFDQYAAAAEELVNKSASSHTETSSLDAPVVVIGYGRFGRAVATRLREHPLWKAHPVVVVDRREDHGAAAMLELRLEPPRDAIVAKYGEAWLAEYEGPPMAGIFLCADDDVGNLRCATLVRRKMQKASPILTILRMVAVSEGHDGFGRHFPGDHAWVFNLFDLLRKDLRTHFNGDTLL